MKRERLLTIAVIGLLLLNLATLGMLLFRSGHEGTPHAMMEHGPHDAPPPGGPVDVLIRETLKLDSSENARFEQLKRTHHDSILALDASYEGLLTSYLSQVSNLPVGAVRDSLERAMAEIQVKKASVTFDHFVALRQVIRPDQQTKLDSIMPMLIRVISPPPEHGPHEPGSHPPGIQPPSPPHG